MKVGIRIKLVVLLTVVALVPLLGALLTITFGMRGLYRKTFGGTILAVADSEAQALKISLLRDLQSLQAILQDPGIVASLARQTAELPDSERKKLDGAWPTLPATEMPLAGILRGPGVEALKRMQRNDRRFAEVLLTDRFGQLAAATGRTTDYFQADEDWWNGAYERGKGQVFIPAVSYDESSGVWSVNLCFPILDGSQVVGICKAVIDISRWIGQMKIRMGQLRGSIMLVSRDGKVIYREKVVEEMTLAEEWTGPIAEGKEPGWRVTKSGEIQAFIPIDDFPDTLPMKVRMPSWSLVLFIGGKEAFGSINRWSLIAFGIGLAGIAILFLAGVLLVDRGLVKRLLDIESAAQRIAKGDLAARIPPDPISPGIRGADELDELIRDFNLMADQVERGHEELKTANEMKQHFIHVAGHELKTPITYILGIAQLLKASGDGSRLRQAMAALGAKAERLNEIIQAMFKLLPEGGNSRGLRCSDIDLPAFLAEISRELQPFLEERHQQLIVEPESGLPILQADRPKLFDVLENLLLNAIKFTPDGGKIQLAVRRQPGGQISFAVFDQGQGVSEKDLGRLFEPFYSGGDVLKHSSGRAGYEKRGPGLGLAIVKHFVELHGGTVQASTGPSGSAFTVVLPLHQPLPKTSG